VPSEHEDNFQGPKTYPLGSKMTPLVHEMDVSSSCSLEDADITAFIEVTSLIGGNDAVEEFLASGMWSLGRWFGFEVDMKASPLSKVTVRMPRIATAIGEQETGDKFNARIEKNANKVIGRYNLAEHTAYQGLRHGRLNHVFELARFLCQPRPEPAGRKQKLKSSNVVTALAVRKTSGK
jgi:hypothetical protein